MEHKRMMNRLLAANMHIIFCLRARDKVKIVKVDEGRAGKGRDNPIGLQRFRRRTLPLR